MSFFETSQALYLLNGASETSEKRENVAISHTAHKWLVVYE